MLKYLLTVLQRAPPGAGAGPGHDQGGQHRGLGAAWRGRPQPRRRQEAKGEL